MCCFADLKTHFFHFFRPFSVYLGEQDETFPNLFWAFLRYLTGQALKSCLESEDKFQAALKKDFC